MGYPLQKKWLVFIAPLILTVCAACTSNPSQNSQNQPPIEQFNNLSLEPGNTVIGVGQDINIFAAYRSSPTVAFPQYLDATAVTWSSSQPSVASVDASGVVRGLGVGSTQISVQYETFSAKVTIEVRGQMIRREVSVPGQGTRYYSVYIPSGATSGSKRMAFLSFHGGGGSAMIQASTSLLNKMADSRGIYIVYPEGSGFFQTWNGGACCGNAQTSAVDDIGFVNIILDDILARDNVDAARVYSTGFSNGGILSHRLACQLSERIAGIAPIGGASGQFDRSLNSYYTCSPTRRIPVLHIHATNDRNYPIEGGYGDGFSATDFYSVDATISDWLVRNNLTSQVTSERIGSSTTCYHYRTKANVALSSAPVTLCVVDPVDIYDPVTEVVHGGGHSWPGGVRSIMSSSDTPIHDFNASEYIYQFMNM